MLGRPAALAIAAAALVPASGFATTSSGFAASTARARAAKSRHRERASTCASKSHGAERKACNTHAGQNALVTLRDPVTGFTVRAPRDFMVSHTAKGVEHVASATRGAFVNYLLVQSAEPPAKVAQTLITQSKSTLSSSSQSASSFAASIVHAGHAETLEVRQVAGGLLAITAWGLTKIKHSHANGKQTQHAGRPRKHGKGSGRQVRKPYGRQARMASGRQVRKASVAIVAAAEPLEPLLKQIAEAAQGGKVVPTPVEQVKKPVPPVALQPFTNSDHSASAEVPVGFNCSGSKGIIECLDPAHGGIEFGVGMPVCVSGSTKAGYAENLPGEADLCPAISPFIESSSTAATTLWGAALDRLTNAGIASVTLLSSQPVSFGAGWNASFDILRFTRNGVPWEAAIVAATTAETGNFEEWLFYYSDVSAPQSGNSAYGQALAKSWASFDPSAADGQRLAESENAQKATTAIIDGADAFRQEVSEEADENWDAIIREAGSGGSRAGEAVEQAKEEIDEKTREAVGRAEEEIEEQLP